MNAGRAARQLIAANHAELGDDAFGETLLFTLVDRYHNVNDFPHAPLYLLHEWGDSMVTITMTLVDDDGDAIGKAEQQIEALSLLEMAKALVDVLAKRDLGDSVAEA
jgi:hypothetical protein